MFNYLIRKYYLMKIPKGNGSKVAVGLSGGVDSSVSAALLRERGYGVTGVFIKVWQPNFLTCSWKEDRRDAMRISTELGIPFKTVDLEEEYKKYVVDYMVEEYKNGHTPNPDVMCNTYVKFGAFYNWAMNNQFEYVATGHYADVQEVGGKKQLVKGLDLSKDQSYFLWQIEQEKLNKVIFPVGRIPKSLVRKIARSYGLSTAAKKDSQGLCFLGHVNIKDFLSNFIELKRGNVLNEEGKIIGKHSGAVVYTIGQRHGFELNNKKDNSKTLYVVKKNVKNNAITVSESPSGYTHNHKNILLRDWIIRSGCKTDDLTAQIRYHGNNYNIKILDNDPLRISFEEKPNGLAEGQSVVIYKNNICVGGGIIDNPVI